MFARLCLIAALLVFPAQAHQSGTLSLQLAQQGEAAKGEFRVRLWPDAHKTQLVIETPQRVEYRILGLQNPSRLVLDISDKRQSGNFLSLPDNSLADAPYLSNVRSARYDPETLRLVFEIKEEIGYEVRTIPPVADYAHRLILDITPNNSPDPLASLLASLTEGTTAQPTGSPDFLVLIDPGHGGEDPGAVSKNNIYEKDIVLSISRKLKAEIEKHSGMRAILTRDKDRFLPLGQRVRIAHKLNADAFVSVHADSVESSRPRGSSVFVLSERGASSKFARRLAKHANLSDIVGGASADPELHAALPDFVKDGKDRASRQLAEILVKNISEINIMHKRHVESAGFAVLKSLSIPSVLVETAFISNPQEEKKLKSEKFQTAMAQAIASGLNSYRNQYEVADE